MSGRASYYTFSSIKILKPELYEAQSLGHLKTLVSRGSNRGGDLTLM